MAHPNQKNQFLPITRRPVLKAAEWGHTIGTDYYFMPNPGLDIFAAANTATGDELAENGWTSTSLVNTAGSGADMFGGIITPAASTGGPGLRGFTVPGFSDAGTPNHVLTDASGDLLASPGIFGDYQGAYMAMRLAGKNVMPRYLVMEFMGSMTVASANEPRSGWGFHNAGATVSVQATQYAFISSNGTNFILAGASATMATGPAIDTNWHLWRIVVQFPGGTTANASVNCYAYMDNTIFSTTAGAGVQDQFPLKFGMHALTTNRPGLGNMRIYYDW